MKNLMTFLFTITAIVISTQLKAQAPEIEWQNTIGGSSFDDLHSIQQTTDGGYILGGNSISGISGDKTEIGFDTYAAGDYWVVKLDYIGTIEWQNTIGGNSGDFLHSVQQTSDGGYILGGYSSSGISGDKTEASLGGTDYWVVKLDDTGGIEWQNTIGGSLYDYLYSVQQTTDAGYILGGYSYSNISGDKTDNAIGGSDDPDYWVVKLDSGGSIVWQNTIGGNNYDYLNSLDQTTDGGYILGGYSYSNSGVDKTEDRLGYEDYWVVKLNSSGDIEWDNTIGGNSYDHLHSIQQTTDGGYILGGSSSSGISGDKTEANIGGGWDYWVVKLDYTGVIEWQNTIGGEYSDYLKSIQQTSDGGYILGGHTASGISSDKTEASLGYSDYWVVKLDSIGNIEWDNTIGGSSDDYLQSVQQTADGGYIVGGYTDSGISGDKTEANIGGGDYWVIKLTGNEICNPISPTGLFADEISATNANLHWDTIPGAEQYVISFWEADDLATARKKRLTTNSFEIIESLIPSTTYGFRVKAVCYDDETISPYSDAYYFTTAPLRLANTNNNTMLINIYPNPAKDEFNIEINSTDFLNQQQIKISITNILGEEVLNKTSEMIDGIFSEQIDIENIADGIYTVTILADEIIVGNKKMVKQ